MMSNPEEMAELRVLAGKYKTAEWALGEIRRLEAELKVRDANHSAVATQYARQIRSAEKTINELREKLAETIDGGEKLAAFVSKHTDELQRRIGSLTNEVEALRCGRMP